MRVTAFIAAVFVAAVMAVPQGAEEVSRGLVRRDECVSSSLSTIDLVIRWMRAQLTDDLSD